MKKYQKLANKMIKKSFPDLKDEKMIIKESRLIYGARVIYLFFVSIIIVGMKKKIKYSNMQLRGGFAHELSHIETFKKEGFWKSAAKFLLAIIYPELTKKIERETDILAIKKGYGKELYSIRKLHLEKADKKSKRTIKKYYLSLEKIKKYAKSIGKW